MGSLEYSDIFSNTDVLPKKFTALRSISKLFFSFILGSVGSLLLLISAVIDISSSQGAVEVLNLLVNLFLLIFTTMGLWLSKEEINSIKYNMRETGINTCPSSQNSHSPTPVGTQNHADPGRYKESASNLLRNGRNPAGSKYNSSSERTEGLSQSFLSNSN